MFSLYLLCPPPPSLLVESSPSYKAERTCVYLPDIYLAFADTFLPKAFQCLVWYTPITLALRKLLQEDGQLEASRGWTIRPFLASLSTGLLHICPTLFISFEYSAEVFFPKKTC